MGLRCSWVAVRADKATVLEALGLAETEQTVLPESGVRPFSASQRPGGWYVVVSDEPSGFGEADAVELSKLGPAVGCQMDETVMVSRSWHAEGGQLLWSAAHDEEDGGAPFHVSGEAPGAAEIHARLAAKQASAPGTDYLYVGPLEMAKAVCGYKLDEVEEEFTALRAMDRSRDTAPRPKGRGLLARLFGR